MNLILNIVAKDARKHRWAVGALLVVTLTKFGVGWTLWAGPTRGAEQWEKFGSLASWLTFAELGLIWLIAGRMMIDDGVGAPAGEWRTRPISLARLMTAKALGALALLCGPGLLLALPWWSATGLGAGDMARSAVVSLVPQLAMVGTALFFGSIADSMARYVMWSVMGYCGLIMMPLIATLLATWVPALGGFWAYGLVAGGLLAVRRLVKFEDESQQRIHRRMSGALATVVLVAGCVAVFVADLPTAREWSDAKADVAASVTLAWQETALDDLKRSQPVTEVRTTLAIKGVPEGMAVDLAKTEHAWSWGGAEPLRATGAGYFAGPSWLRDSLKLPLPKPDAETERWEAAREAEQAARRPALGLAPARPARRERVIETTAKVSPSIGARLRSAAPDYAVTARLRVMQPVQWANLPLTAGAEQSADGHGLRLGALEKSADSLVVRAIEARPLPWDFLQEFNRGLWRRPTYYAVDPTTGRLVTFGVGRSASVWVGGVEVQALSLEVRAPRVIRDGKWTVLDPAWSERTRLMLVRWDERARITREVRAEKLLVMK